MAREIKSDKLYMKGIFENWYRIPEYQRPFVWEPEQVLELLTDIEYALQNHPEGEYFLGSMVLCAKKKRQGDMEYVEYDLLDGQQRLTTLLLLFAVIRDTAPEQNQLYRTCAEKIYQEGNEYDGTPERMRIVFDIRKQVKDFIDTYVRLEQGTARESELKLKAENLKEDVSVRNMARAILTIRTFIQQVDCKKFLAFLLKNVLMIYVSSEELEDAFQLFTVMNNRGVKLRNCDILKAENLSAVPDETLRAVYARQWEDTETFFGESFDAFLSYLRTILVKRKASFSLLQEFEDKIYHPKEYNRTTKCYIHQPALLQKGEETFKMIERYRTAYEQLFECDNYSLHTNYELCNLLQVMKLGLESDYWIAPVLYYYVKFGTEGLLPFVHLLNQKVAADWISGVFLSNRIENINQIIRVLDEANRSEEVISSSAFSFDEEGLRLAMDAVVYGRRFAKYLLLLLDLLKHGSTSRIEIPRKISIEHILPQNPMEESRWCRDFTQEQRDYWTDRIGNLVLLSRSKNASLNNRDYVRKKEIYFKRNVEVFSNSIRIYQRYTTWMLTDLIQNHRETLNDLFGYFKLERFEVDYPATASTEEISLDQSYRQGNGNRYDEIRKTYPNAYTKWNDADDERLNSLFLEGKTVEELVLIFGRQPGGISSRLRKLGYEID